jgi:hypothetical protein
MGRKKIEFTKEQDECITQMVNDGYSLNGILSFVNNKFQTNFSRSGIDRRIKTLGIDRNKIVKDNMMLLSKSDIIKFTINKWFYNTSHNYKERIISTQYTLDAYAKRMKVSKPTLLKYIRKYKLPTKITPDMKEFFDITDLDLRMYKKGTVDAIIKQLKSKTDVVIEPNAIIKVGNTNVTVELYFPEYSAVLLFGCQDDYYTKQLGESEIPISCMSEWFRAIKDNSNYKVLCYRLEYNHFHKRITQYNIKYVCDSIIKDLGLQLKELD